VQRKVLRLREEDRARAQRSNDQLPVT